MEFSEELLRLADEAEEALAAQFRRIDKIAFENTKKVMDSFASHRVSDMMFESTTGYGYDDRGRDTLDEIWADVMGAESAFVRHTIVSGTHALTIALFGILRPGDTMLSVAGKPYDTLEEVIGITGTEGNGSLRDFGVTYHQIDLIDGKAFDFPAIGAYLRENKETVKMVFVQRSKGYLNRKTLRVSEIGELVRRVKEISPEQSEQIVKRTARDYMLYASWYSEEE